MRILLPPSEAKRTNGHPIGPDRSVLGDAHSGLAQPRARVAQALIKFCDRNPVAAAAALALPPRSAASDLESNVALMSSPTCPALDRYAGTVYEGLDVATLTTAARRRAMESVVIFSGLLGVVRAREEIPLYRLPVAASVPPIGPLTAYWRSAAANELAEVVEGQLIVDLRSGDYGAMWRPAPALRDQIIRVRIVTEQPGGKFAVISYPSKFGKGRLTRALLGSRSRITSIAQVAQAWTDSGERDAILRPDGGLDLVTAWVSPPTRPGYTRPRP